MANNIITFIGTTTIAGDTVVVLLDYTAIWQNNGEYAGKGPGIVANL